MKVKKQFFMAPLAAAMLLPMSLMTGNAVAKAMLLEEVTVTARKRVENLQETPLSIVAFSADTLDKQNITNIIDLGGKLPNVSIGGSGGLGSTNAAFVIRGNGTTRNAVNQEPAVALYIDDAYYGRSDGALLNVIDVAQIEVLRGPQGTLFGRNATGGAIRYVSAKPEDEFASNIQLTAGSFSRFDVKGMVNVPVGETMALRINAASLTRDGHVDRVSDGLDLGDINSQAIRGQFRWSPNENFEALLTADYSKTDTNGAPAILSDINPNALFVTGEAAAGFDATTVPLNDYENSRSTGRNFNDTDSSGFGATLLWDIGELTFKSSTNYREVDVSLGYDGDGTPASLFEQVAIRNIEAFSQELQLSGSSDNLDWVAGVFYYDEDATDDRDVLTTVNSRNRTATRITNPISTQSLAVFAQSTYPVTEQFSVTGGLRFTKDEKDIFASELRGPNVFATATASDSWSKVTGRISGEYKVDADVFVFASYARGFRAGSINDRLRTELPNNGILPFDQEILDTYEVGIRSDLLDSRLRLNLTAFYSDFTDIQIAEIVPGTNRTIVQNAGEADIKGLEGELVFALSERLILNAAFGLIDASFTDLNAGVGAVTLDSDFQRTPSSSYVIGTEANFPLSDGELVARLDWSWRNSQRLIDSDANRVIQDSYGLLGAQISYEPGNEKWKISLFGTNLTDKEYAISGLNLARNTPIGVEVIEPGRPFEVGVKLDWRF